MSGNDQAKGIHTHLVRQKVDRRILRTRDRLGDALVALMQEKPFDDITVQEVLDRAGVSRSTFYVHYRDKDDLFLSDVDEFLDFMANGLSRHEEKSERVAPVRELFAHVGQAQRLYAALVEAGRIADFIELAEEHFARGIERRLTEIPRAQGIADAARAPLAHALAGAMLSMLQWWLDRGMPESPEQMDTIFHQMVWSGVSYEAAGTKKN
jgi:AcrR family transcriptional regulator